MGAELHEVQSFGRSPYNRARQTSWCQLWENFKAMTEQWTECWSRFLELPQDSFRQAINILQQRYAEETQQRDRFNQHADKMHYPQFRQKLLRISDEKTQYADRIAEAIVALGGKLPSVPELRSTDENSWQQLMIALDDENRSADHLAEQLRGIQSDIPDVVKLLQHVSEQQKQHRGEVRDMLMRSDSFAFSLA
jgi:rubrerythrin